MFTAALPQQPNCHQPRVQMDRENMGGGVYMHTMEYCSAIKKTEILSFAGKWMELESIMVSVKSQAQKVKCRMFSLI
jgi:hypothetical protein